MSRPPRPPHPPRLAGPWAVLRVLSAPLWRPLQAFAHWLHLRWPAGRVEPLPVVREDGTTNVPGLYVVGDLTGIPLLKFAADSGVRAVRAIAADPAVRQPPAAPAPDDVLDLLIVGAGVSGLAAALEARKLGLRCVVLEAAAPLATLRNFPRGKPIYTYPTDMVPAGDLQFRADTKESLLAELRAQTAGTDPMVRSARVEKVERRGQGFAAVLGDGEPVRARRAILALGRSGNFRTLQVPGAELDKVANRLHDPQDYGARRVLVVGGGDSAVETAIAIASCGGTVDLSYRGRSLSRPKPDNLAALERLRTRPAADPLPAAGGSYLDEHRAPGHVELHLQSTVQEIRPDAVVLGTPDGTRELPNDAVFTMIGREPPLEFLRRSGVHIRGETRGLSWLLLALFFLFIWALYDWKNHGPLSALLPAVADDGFPQVTTAWLRALGAWWAAQVDDRSTVIGTLAVSATSRSFYFTLLYTLCIGWFGIRRIRRRRTPYVTVQTACLFAVQAGPLFLLPELLLPYLGYNGWFDTGLGQQVADQLFSPLYITPEAWATHDWGAGGHPRAYWRAYGFILAFPLMIYNVLTPGAEPYTWWLILTAVQLFVILPLLVWKWGKGAFCGWICSCGGLAETMGDTQRHKMFHGPASNRWNLLGQVILWAAFGLLALRLWTWWVAPDGWLARTVDFHAITDGFPFGYKWTVDVLLGGLFGVGLYFKYSGRLWCRFACPLAALMHIYARFSRFRILADKQKCISCNACTATCHMGIDVMNFANKGLPMADPQCVRCSACVHSCPTDVLEFGEVDGAGRPRRRDRLAASRLAADTASRRSVDPAEAP